MKRLFFMGLFMVSFVFPSFSYADGVPTYVGFKLGYFMPNDDSDGMKEFDDTVSFGMSLGAIISDQLAGEIGLEYYKAELDNFAAGTGYLNSVFYTAIYDAELSVWSLPVTAKWLLPVDDGITAFLGGGIALHRTKLENSLTYQFTGYGTGILSDSDTGSCLGIHLVAGLDFDIQQNLKVGAELKWSSANQKIKSSADDDEDDFYIGGTTISLNAKFLF